MNTVDVEIQPRRDGFWVILFSEDDESIGWHESGPYDTYLEAAQAGNALISEIEVIDENSTATRH